MADGFLSQEEIDALLNGDGSNDDIKNNEEVTFSDQDRDLLGEIGNISMGSASTALSQVLNQSVNITTPVVNITTIGKLKSSFEVPNIVLEVEYVTGIVGKNILMMKIPDAAVIANLMMGGNGIVESTELTEIEISAVQEAMNQMIGSAATSMATMFAREVNISPPNSKIWEDLTESISQELSDEEDIINISFNIKIGELVDSQIMQILPIETGRKIVKIMMGEEEVQESLEEKESILDIKQDCPITERVEEKTIIEEEPIHTKTIEVGKAKFESLDPAKTSGSYNNIDLIMDVPLQVSVVLGKTKKSIKEVLNLGVGSVIELEKLADEPLEILVNGKQIAYGEVVVIDENFGIRITSIATGAERIKSLR
ncbi:MAG: flagellar motor switch phosphatase FliY [Sarcina sp.]